MALLSDILWHLINNMKAEGKVTKTGNNTYTIGDYEIIVLEDSAYVENRKTRDYWCIDSTGRWNYIYD